MTAPTIAVIVPNWNDSRYLRRCLGSVFDQPVPADEVIIVDDKSTDDSVAVIRELIAGRRGARLIENPVNLGVYGAVDAALKHTQSEYVLFLAANDFILPGLFKRAKECLARAPGIGLWSAMAWIVDETGSALRLHLSPVPSLGDAVFSPERCIELAHRFGNWFTGTSLIYRRSALEEAGRFDRQYMGLSDLLTALVVASRHGAAYTPEPLCAIRKHTDSYLSRTLAEPGRLEDIVRGLLDHGRRSAPALFTPAFAERTARRLRFASVRSTGGATLEAVAALSSAPTRAALLLVKRLLPASWRRARLACAYALLCPFDIVPAAWYRGLGWVIVRARSRRPKAA